MKKSLFNELGQEIFEKRYAYPGEKHWSERAKAIAKTLSLAEKEEDRKTVEDKIYEVVSCLDLIPGGRINYGSGRNTGKGGHNLLNCFNLTPYDTVESIGRTIQDTYKISCAGGGIGFNFYRIRPRGDDIQNIKNSAPGAVSVMKMINEIGNHIKAGKNRRLAIMGMLTVNHPDMLEFLDVKLDQNQLNNFNISVAIDQRFIEAVENDEDWYFFFGNKKYYIFDVVTKGSENEGYACNHQHSVRIPAFNEEDAIGRANNHLKRSSKESDLYVEATKVQYKAKDLWDRIYKSSLECGDPGIFNLTLANQHTNVSYFQKLIVTNPCGEIPLEERERGGGNCCLGHINLANMVLDDGSDIDWKRFAKTVRAGVRALDNVLDVNHYPTEDCREAALETRRIGLGLTGYAYMLIKLGIKYGSEECLEFTERLMTTLRDEAYKQSIYLARDKSPFPNFDAKKYLEEGFAKTLPPRIRMMIKEYGIRNAVLLTVAPTGTISLMAGVSSGIEPIFAGVYKRRYRDANVWKETFVVDPLLSEYIEQGKEDKMDLFLGAYDVTPEQHIQVQACIQKYIDQSVSKTINLPSNYNGEELSSLALKYAPYLKGLTIYRAGSKGNEPLEAIPIETIKNYIKPKMEMAIADGAVCKANGECG